MFYDIYIIIVNILKAILTLIGFFSCFYFVAWIGSKYEDRNTQNKKI